MLSILFSNLYEQEVISVMYGDVMVKKSHVNSSCVIVYARKPIEFVMDLAAEKSISPTWIDSVKMHLNTDGSLSIWEINPSGVRL